MVSEITRGIKVEVETEYQNEYSSPAQSHFVFTYRINIENNSNNTVQLINRVWHIHDAGRPEKEIMGEGVVGQQPVLEPGESHQYVSGCNLNSGLGKMYGSFEMEKVISGERIRVNIPEFTMIVPFKLN